MLLTGKYQKDSRLGSLPLEVYDTIVRSLHGDSRTLIAGKFATFIAGLLAAYKVGQPALYLTVTVLMLVGIARALHIMRFNRLAEQSLNYIELKQAELRYRIYSGGYVGMLGVMCFISLATTNDQIAHLILISATLANVAGITGRNFASLSVVHVQAIGVTIPLVLGLLMFGTVYHALLGCLLLPFLLAIESIARHLRATLLEATFQALDNKTIADRFEAALKNASHGMAMIDRSSVFVVVNACFSELFGLKDGRDLVGTSLCELTSEARRHMSISASSEHLLSERIRQCLIAQERVQFTHTRPDGATIEVTFNPMNEGAGVIVLEDVSARVKSEQEIRQLANFDPLTHLPNRRYFAAEVKARIEKDGGDAAFSLFFADLDNFKTINDSLGHPIGDKLICAVALRMKSCLPEDGHICRFGGDEFVIFLPGMTGRHECERFARKMMAEVAKPVLIDGHLIIVGSSIGIAICPDHSNDFDQLLKMADLSLYEAKSNGRDELFFYSETLGERARRRQELEVDLRRTVHKGELQVHYQPLFDIHTNRITCCEALVRWHHPTLGNVPPSDFIPMAEEIGLITKIGRFVLETATAECAKWPDDVRVAVNVSSLQFQQSNVCDVVNAALSKSGLAPDRLEVEVTESSVLNDLHETADILRTLADRGIRISLDDFGTGFSSLSYLHQLPLHKVKIDRSFLNSIREDKRSLVLLSGICRLAADLGLRVIVEGIEEADQLDILKKQVHIDEAQGFLFGKAVPGRAIRQMLKEQAEPKSRPKLKAVAG
ncbi:MAG: EAL domain-containing protein [Nitratireductor sp.]|nr:EAL domain-containing protein [Nitratireductor sp.]